MFDGTTKTEFPMPQFYSVDAAAAGTTPAPFIDNSVFLENLVSRLISDMQDAVDLIHSGMNTKVKFKDRAVYYSLTATLCKENKEHSVNFDAWKRIVKEYVPSQGKKSEYIRMQGYIEGRDITIKYQIRCVTLHNMYKPLTEQEMYQQHARSHQMMKEAFDEVESKFKNNGDVTKTVRV